MGLNKNKPITYEMTPSAAKAVNSTLNNGFFTPVTGREEQEGINVPEPLEASTSTGYLPDATSREGQSLINKWTGKTLIGSMAPEQIEALPRDYSKRVKDRINATILAGQVNNAQNDAGNFIFSKALPAGLTIAGLGPFGSLVNSMGFLPALGTTAASIGGGYLGATGLGYVGRKIDEKYGTKLEPWMSMGGGFLGGYLGAAGGYGLSSKIAQYNAYKPWAEKVFSPEMLFDAKQAIYRNQLANLRDHEIRMNKPNTYETVLPENGPTINAAGNAEGIIINPLVNRIYNLQVTKGLQSHNPSKLTREELIGWPKAKRNNAVRIQNPIVNDVLNNHKYGTINPDELIETVAIESSPGSYSNDPIKKFVSTLDVDTHPAFKSITKDGKLFEHPSVTEFRNYLNNNGVDASAYSTDELSKLLTYEFLDKTKTATGALKDMILWHASDGNFDAFDFMTHLGKNTGNRGLYGMGNYFSTEFPQQYGVNAQPFIINGVNNLKHYSQIKSWRNMPIFKDKTVPKGLAVVGSNSGPYVKTTFRPYMNYEGIAPYEIVVPQNHDIKSLFPHPSRFIQQPDGSVILKSTDWNDIRFNFKNGGKLISKK